MLIVNDINRKSCVKLLKYLINKCDVVSLTKYHDQHTSNTNKVIDVIRVENPTLLENIVSFSDDLTQIDMYINKACQLYKDDSRIFDSEYKNKYEQIELLIRSSSNWKMENRKSMIRDSLMWYIYDKRTSHWLFKVRNSIISKENNIFVEPFIHSTTYYLKLTDEIKSEILSKSSIYNWSFPYSLEDISFFMKKQCLLCSVSHEEYCSVYCQNEQEYNYLKSIGITFIDTKN